MTTIQQDASASTQDVSRLSRPDQRYGPAALGGEWSYTLSVTPDFMPVVERSEGYWIVRDPATGIFGRGEDVLSGVRDFRRAVEEHLDVLERQPELSEELSGQLEYLRVRLRR